MTEPHKFDLRLVYLAIHHIVKNRGYFLDKAPMTVFENTKHDYPAYFKQAVTGFSQTDLNELVQLVTDHADEFAKTAVDDSIMKREKKNQLLDLIFESTGNKVKDRVGKKVLQEFIKAVLSDQFKIDTLFQIEGEGIDKLSFEDEDYEAKTDTIMAGLTTGQIKVLEAAQKIYSSIALEQLVPDGKSFSEMQIESYNRWHKQFKTVKTKRLQEYLIAGFGKMKTPVIEGVS